MKQKIASDLKNAFGSGNELSCYKKIAKELHITIPSDLDNRALTVCLHNLIAESVDARAKEFLKTLNFIKNTVYDHYIADPNELIR